MIHVSADHLTHRTHFTKALWAYNWNLVKIIFPVILILEIQSCNSFAHVKTAELSWHVQNWDIILLSFTILEQHIFLIRFWLWALKPFVKWAQAATLLPTDMVEDPGHVAADQSWQALLLLTLRFPWPCLGPHWGGWSHTSICIHQLSTKMCDLHLCTGSLHRFTSNITEI